MPYFSSSGTLDAQSASSNADSTTQSITYYSIISSFTNP
ncbi:hypothetical protein NT01EI_2784 [Edwardsiella ictaluri 93-146]|uniref:Uncharacterized protein n=1 Tax=Edwardsiella ictaluri (strain 93-146) TaxID=634503 RepID=C5BEF1_EDWI9|nr:hypothetical protein NT01EI_2784 [Edwardsiella ictaluri 93-146]